MSISKSEIAAEIAKKQEISKAKALATVNQTIDLISAALKKGKKVSLIGFGTFLVRKRKARTGRNPQTGKAIKIKASNAPAFKAGASLKKLVNK